MISSIYSNVKSYVKVNGKLSKSFGCSLGLRQGCVLSPILFSLFINDLDEDTRSLNTMGCKLYDTVIHTLLYADDLIIFANSKEELQMKIDKLSDFCSKWELVVGLPKTKIMIFGGGYNVAEKNSFYFRGSSEFWGHKDLEKNERINLHFYKFILEIKQLLTKQYMEN